MTRGRHQTTAQEEGKRKGGGERGRGGRESSSLETTPGFKQQHEANSLYLALNKLYIDFFQILLEYPGVKFITAAVLSYLQT